MDTNDENANDISHDLEILKTKLNSQRILLSFIRKSSSKEDAIFCQIDRPYDPTSAIFQQ